MQARTRPAQLHVCAAGGDGERAARRARDAAASTLERPKQALQRTGFWQGLAEAQQRLQPVPWNSVLAVALVTGLTFGTAFQVTHNQGLLPAYDVWAFRVGPFLEAGTIPLTLAPIWLLYSYLQPLLDASPFFDGADRPAIQRAQQRASSLGFLAVQWAELAAMFLLSDWVYFENLPHWQCSAILAVVAAATWKAFDGTKPGLLLGALLAVGAPCAETIIVNVLHLWHYDRPDFFGVPHWTGWCYAAYAWGVGNFGRYLVQAMSAGQLGDERRSATRSEE